jgi:DNA-binding PadR family transcriptional regulator
LIHSVLDLFILSLLDRGLETPYDLQRQGGLSLGSTVPALRRLESAGLVRKKASVALSKRPRHWFQLSATGRRLARRGWIPLLKDQPPSDFDAALRLADMARHYGARPADIVKFLEAAASERRSSARSGVSEPRVMRDSVGLVATREAGMWLA